MINGTIWLTGISSSGKTTLALKLIDDLKQIGIKNIVMIDGDIIRKEIINYNYDINNREEMGLLKASIAREENSKGNIAVVTGIAAKKKWREVYRKMIANYFEVFLDCSLKACIERDQKNIYQKAIKGEYENFPGVTEMYETSNKVDLILNTEKNSIKESSKILMQNVVKFIDYN